MSENLDWKFREGIGNHTFRLFNEPSFSDGFTSILDFKKLIDTYNTDSVEELADNNSIRSDWRAVGGDIQRAFNEYESEAIAGSTK